MARNPLAAAGTGKGSMTYSSALLKTVEEVQFGIFSPEDVKKMSVVEVLYPEMMVIRPLPTARFNTMHWLLTAR